MDKSTQRALAGLFFGACVALGSMGWFAFDRIRYHLNGNSCKFQATDPLDGVVVKNNLPRDGSTHYDDKNKECVYMDVTGNNIIFRWSPK